MLAIDWAARIDEVTHQLAREYTVEDREAVEILLAALVNCPRTPASWIILETNWFSRTCDEAWFSFGGHWMPQSLARLRARSPWRVIEAEIEEWLNNPSDEHLFIECDFERYPYFHRLTQAHFLLQRSLRVRTRCARAADPLRGIDKIAEERRADNLNAAARYALEDRAGLRTADPPRFAEPASFLYYCELLQRLAPWYPDWQTLVQALALLAVRRAYLLGRTETDESDNRILARVLRDSIPPWVAKALRLLGDGPSQTQTVEKHMQLEEKTRRSGHGAHRELVRLHRGGLVRWNKQAQHWEIVEEHRQGIADALAGKAFGSQAGS